MSNGLTIRDVLELKLNGLETEIFDYICTILEENDDEFQDREKNAYYIETIASFLMGVEFCSSEEACTHVCKEILVMLQIMYSKTSPLTLPQDDIIPPPPPPTSQPTPARIASMTSLSSSAASSTEDLGGKVKAIKEKKEPKEKKVKEPKDKKGEKGDKGKSSKKLSPYELAAQQEAELEAELEAARHRSAEARSRDGAFNGALEASSFTLPNPGGGAPLLENASCTLVRGRRYGLIGRNGKGKSTMLKALASRRVGEIPDNVSVHYVSQEVQLSEETKLQTPLEAVVAADVERRLLLKEAAILEAQDSLTAKQQSRQNEIIEQLEIIESDTAERRGLELLDNLGFTEELKARPLSALSGGWRVRTMLAAAIFAKPDLLLLDEPTNHLSILAVLWLARELATSETWQDRIIVIVSHDRYFIDEVCSDCLHISGAARRLTQSHGNYSTWAARRKEQQITFLRESAKRQEEIKELKEFAGHGFKYGGSSSAINKMLMKAKQAEKLEEEAVKDKEECAALEEDVELPMKLDSGGEIEGFLIQMINISFGYPEQKILFKSADFGITSKSRIVLLGENGNGKTTLVKILLGHLKPLSGEVRRNPQVRIALVNQHHADQIPLDQTPLQFMQATYPGDSSYEHLQRLRSHLASCGVTGNNPDLQNVPVSALSGGQRSRVALAAVSYSKPHVLFLDEPTNNLDLESVAALADSIKTFKGAVVVVSHDQFFVTEVANEAWVVAAGAVKQVESFQVYRNKQLAKLNKT